MEALQLSNFRFVPRDSYWRNHSNGNIYKVLFLTNTESTKASYPPTVVYIGRDGRRWSKPFAEWSDSFTRIYPAKIITKSFLN